MPLKKLTLEQRLKAARTLDALDCSRQERGARNEIFAQEICMGFVARGLIERFWAAPQNSALDHMGIDLVCETSWGYFFLDIKSSFTGAAKRVPRDYSVYPWIVVRYREQAEAEGKLMGILDCLPSCTFLPKKVQDELIHLTPNVVLHYEPPAIGKRERAILHEIAKKDRRKNEGGVKNNNKKGAVKNILDSNMNSQDKLSRLEREGMRIIRKTDTFNGFQWCIEIEVEIFDMVFSGDAARLKKKEAELAAGNVIVARIAALIK